MVKKQVLVYFNGILRVIISQNKPGNTRGTAKETTKRSQLTKHTHCQWFCTLIVIIRYISQPMKMFPFSLFCLRHTDKRGGGIGIAKSLQVSPKNKGALLSAQVRFWVRSR